MVDRIDSGNASRAADGLRRGSAAPTGRTGNIESSSAVANDTGTRRNSTLQEAEARIAASDGIDREKVEAVKQAITSGQFHIDPDRVAEAFIALESEL